MRIKLPPRLSKRRKPLNRTAIKRSTKPIRKVNPTRKAKRVARYRKMLRSKEYLDARAEAMARAGNRCEHTQPLQADIGHNEARHITLGTVRCPNTTELQAHHLAYPKSRPLKARDLKIVCKRHHEYLESQKMGKTRMF